MDVEQEMLPFVCILISTYSGIHLSLNSEQFWKSIMEWKLWWLVLVLYICKQHRIADITHYFYLSSSQNRKCMGHHKFQWQDQALKLIVKTMQYISFLFHKFKLTHKNVIQYTTCYRRVHNMRVPTDVIIYYTSQHILKNKYLSLLKSYTKSTTEILSHQNTGITKQYMKGFHYQPKFSPSFFINNFKLYTYKNGINNVSTYLQKCQQTFFLDSSWYPLCLLHSE